MSTTGSAFFGTGLVVNTTGASAKPSASSWSGSTPLQIGQVQFFTEEVPEELAVGAAEQMLVVTNNVGGSVVAQAFGNKPKAVTWHGRFWAQNVKPRVQQLRLYQVGGTLVNLIWGAEQYSVIVKEFVPTYKGGYCEYSITVEPIASLNGAFTVSNPATIDQQVAALQQQINAANALAQAADPTGSQSYQSAIQNLYTLLAQYAPLAATLPVGSTAILGAVQAALAALQAYQSTLPAGASWLPAVLQMEAFVSCIGTNVTQGQSFQSIEAMGGSLFEIASQYYGDPSQAFALMQANSLSSPFLSATETTTIVLPPLQPNTSSLASSGAIAA